MSRDSQQHGFLNLQRNLLLPSLGLALCFAFRSADRYTAIAFPNQDSLIDPILLGIARLAPLIVLAFAYHNRHASIKEGRIPSGKATQGFLVPFLPRILFVGVTATVGLSVLYASSFGLPVTSEAITIGKMLLGVANTLFLVAYAELVLCQGREITVQAFITSSYLFGVLRIILGLLTSQTALVLLLLCPALSCLCLYEAISSQKGQTNVESSSEKKCLATTPLLSRSNISLLISIAGYTFIFTALHLKWLNPGSSSVYIAIALQIAPGLGIIAGAFLISRMQAFLTEERLPSYSMLLPPLAILVLYLSTFTSDYLLIALSIPLFAVQRLVFFIIWILSLFQKNRFARMRVFCLGMICLELGTSSYSCLAGLANLLGINNDSLFFFPTVIVLALLISQQLLLWFFTEQQQSESKKKKLQAEKDKSEIDMIPKELMDSLQEVADYYKLTKRERELLPYLLLGRAPDYIGKAMFIEPSTVKTHIKNIYRKVNVSKRTDLLLLIENWHDEPEN